MAICNRKHRFLPEYEALPYAQDNQNGGRHICAGCAFEAGVQDGMAGRPLRTDLSDLPYSQAGTVRHKDAYEAYQAGHAYGKKISS